MSETIVRPSGGPASGRITPASFPFFTTGEDNLRVISYNAAAGVRLKINGRLLDAKGVASPDSWDHTPNTDRSAATTDLPLSGSTLLNLTVFASAGAPLMGQTFVIVQLIRGIGAAAIVLGTILQGYVTTTQAIGWPGSPIQTSVDSGGYLRQIQGTQPALGAEILETVPTGARWELLAVNTLFTTSAAAATRLTRLAIVHTTHMTSIVMPVSQALASGVYWRTYAQNLPVSAELILSTGQKVSQQPILLGSLLLAGDVFKTLTDQIQAGDLYLLPLYLVREWLEP